MVGLVDGNNFFVSCERVIKPSLRGKPFAVLSNNDGCCISRSNEFKALGIPMGTPYFLLKDREASGELTFCSSNYELYGDMSRRIVSILREDSVEVEQYSIDEAFIHPPTTVRYHLESYGTTLRAKILKWTGIPCGVGFAPTKTLAKIANHIGKKQPSGVFVMPDDPTPILRDLPVDEVWGIGRQLGAKLRGRGILTAEQFRRLSEDELRTIGSVLTVRTALELHGTPCIDDRAYDADPDSVTCSRSFGEPVTTADALAESIANFAAQAAVKLRRHALLAAGCNIYAQLGTACEGSWTERTVVFDEPTDATNVILSAIRQKVDALFIPGARYRKSGVIFFGIEKAGAARQGDLFSATAPLQSSALYRIVDGLNARYGKSAVFSAAEGLEKNRKWKMRRNRLSPRATTQWKELIVVH